MRYRGYFSLLAIASLAGCAPRSEPTATDFQQLSADAVMFDVRHVITADGIRSAIGQFDTVYVFEDSSKIEMEGVVLDLFGPTGVRNAKLTALRGELQTGTQAMVARGSVRLEVASDTSVIETEELHYDPASHRIWSTVATTRRYQGQTLETTGFSADDQFRRIEYTSPRGQLPGIKVQF